MTSLSMSGRRKFLTGQRSSGGRGVPPLQRSCAPMRGPNAPRLRVVTYPSNRLGNVHDLKVNEPIERRLSQTTMHREC